MSDFIVGFYSFMLYKDCVVLEADYIITIFFSFVWYLLNSSVNIVIK